MAISKRHTCVSCNRKRDEYFMQKVVERSNNGLPKWACRENHYSSKQCVQKFKNLSAESVRVNSDVSPGTKVPSNQVDLLDLIEELKRENENYKQIIN